MAFSIKRSSNALEVEGITANKAYAAVGFTDGNVIILNDNGQPVPVGYKTISDDGEWSASGKEAKAPKKSKSKG